MKQTLYLTVQGINNKAFPFMKRVSEMGSQNDKHIYGGSSSCCFSGESLNYNFKVMEG
jgi:hypothetical protein